MLMVFSLKVRFHSQIVYFIYLLESTSPKCVMKPTPKVRGDYNKAYHYFQGASLQVRIISKYGQYRFDKSILSILFLESENRVLILESDRFPVLLYS